MANKKHNLGPVLSQIQGLHVRFIAKNTMAPNNHYGVYAGKRLYKTFPTQLEAEKCAHQAQSDKYFHRNEHKQFQDFKNLKS